MSTIALDTSRWIEEEPKPLAAGALTFAVHAAFAAVLLLNMSWQQRVQPHASVKLWESSERAQTVGETGATRAATACTGTGARARRSVRAKTGQRKGRTDTGTAAT